jgi:hypothetical protein
MKPFNVLGVWGRVVHPNETEARGFDSVHVETNRVVSIARTFSGGVFADSVRCERIVQFSDQKIMKTGRKYLYILIDGF